MSEFAFELALCAHLERSSNPPVVGANPLIARQLGGSVADPGGRILDLVCIEPGLEFDERTAITDADIPDAAIESAVGPGRARYWKDAFDCHPSHARRAVERACEIGFFESERRNGREYVRQVARYPDWYDRIVAIENKPDLGRPGDLEMQLRTDVSLALVDEVILATESYVTRAHLHRLPDPVGVWRVHRDRESTDSSALERGAKVRAGAEAEVDVEAGVEVEIEVVREPTPLPTAEPGIEPLAFEPGRTEIEPVSAAAKARARRRLAERAYGKGWRTYDFPACASCVASDEASVTLPHCTWAGDLVDANADCGPDCPGYKSATAPEVDLESERDRQTPWRASPRGRRRRQSGLDQFR
ncbi:uncharacterized protein Nmag_1484 [Natrialba magadii ATCC 43099]|uniref:Uncharacterized protein n=1 Tax=Natrialba magadii (strain ATCC 43099 / DSM 3394 / CCM 3739 / CIP 104546 / IAM 13178 / JCM 8861 / NBRC 102185 / NCIMB 2190 / MS3) TaxID=547559 RepID=D3STP4_NATMM|nr:DUF5787 family protein [Natrialba magadii]ADD05061.1 uncharacterized protein Nmag_1484 [Natrialba magadii ATCC 43099]ELY23434.1 hypothetical protein C500_19939 [Natrialba magadii ATCC 43099]